MFLNFSALHFSGLASDHAEEGRDSNPEPQTRCKSQEATPRNDVRLPPASGLAHLLCSVPAGHGQHRLPRRRRSQFNVPILRHQLRPRVLDDVTVCRVRNGLPPSPPSSPRQHGRKCRVRVSVRHADVPHVGHAELVSRRRDGIKPVLLIQLFCHIFGEPKALTKVQFNESFKTKFRSSNGSIMFTDVYGPTESPFWSLARLLSHQVVMPSGSSPQPNAYNFFLDLII